MRKIIFAVGVLLAGISFGYAQEDSPAARADLYNSEGKVIGNATLTESPDGVIINLEASDLPLGVHAIHIHEAGQCEPPDFKSAGGHFNPYGKKHGVNNPEGWHIGDLPNIEVAENGFVLEEVVAPDVTLGPGENSLFHPGGTSLVIHADADDEKTDPAGNAGARIACGVITKVEE